MKSLFLVLSIFFVSLIDAQEVEWISMNEALEAQEKEPKKIFLDVYTTWCGPCKAMDKKTFNHPDVAKYLNENFYAVKFNGEGTETVFYNDFEYTNPNHDPNRKGRNAQHLFAAALKVQAYPTVVFFDEEANIISPVRGYKSAQQLEVYLKMINENHYKEITTSEAWKDYQANFENTFKP